MPNSLRVFTDAALTLAAARPTNTTMARTLRRIVADIAPWYSCTQVRDVHGHDVVGFVDQLIDECERAFDADYDVMSEIGSSLIADGEGILTTCFAEHSFILSLVKARDAGKRFTVYVPETRPYLQGARLTAPALDELGIDAYLITDGMGVHFMESKAIGRYMSAADLVAMDGTVVNKVGSLANAVCAAHFGIPYQVFAMSPDPSRRSHNAIVMEQRDGNELLSFAGNPVTLAGRKADGSIVLLQTDGRQSAWSNGISHAEGAALMLQMGCTDALVLDGGGSSTAVARMPGEVSPTLLNRPSDGTERKISNALLVASRALPQMTPDPQTGMQPAAAAAMLHLYPDRQYLLPGAEVSYRVLATDPAYHASAGRRTYCHPPAVCLAPTVG
jgi:translation initiation factor 2B subunit (eIF-2B alpha/beta/delta family)